MHPDFIKSDNQNVDYSLSTLIDAVRKSEQERIIQLLLSLGHLVESEVAAYIVSFIREEQPSA